VNLSQLQELQLDGFWDKFEGLPEGIADWYTDLQRKMAYPRNLFEAFADPLM
jgi:hypothetical protein